ncbi:MAG: phospho-N-acetylmuramoyl-pentapeptide-transferase [Clostridiales bacterium]|nr:phospho-N-acetylmuramoyl-pentapeptide-transferase [Clostridiales bacterium]
MISILLALITAFVVTTCAMPLTIKLTKKLKLRQTILSYVDNHSGKSGTPTMGGIGFLLGIAVASFISGIDRITLISTVVMLGYGVVGFLDDFIKVYFKRNEGLKPYQKIIFQLLIAVIISVSAYYNSSEISLIFTKIDLGIFVIPLNIFLFLAFTNSVNLTDGLDGLASTVMLVSMVFLAAIIGISSYYNSGQASSLTILCLAIVGGMFAFLMFNSYPAKIFMGDTGSLALGGAFAAITVYSGELLASALTGIMFIVSAVSVILQVLHYKRTKNRIFLMAPYHHHLERKGLHENRIVSIYAGVTFVVSALTLLAVLLCNI